MKWRTLDIGDSCMCWGFALVIGVISYQVISLRIATSYHLAVVVEQYEDRVWLRLFNARWLERPDGFIGNELLAQDAAWQSQDYVLMDDQFAMTEPMRTGHFGGELTSRAVTA